MQQEEGLTAEERIRRSASYLIKEEQRWFAFFHQHGIQPIFLQYEDVTGDPGKVFEKLSAAFHLPYERDNLQSYAKIERGGRYRNQANQKAELRYLHRDLLHEFADLRNRQFDELTKRYGLPLASIS